MLFNLLSKNTPAYICLDSNINLLNICSSHTHFSYLSTINESNFTQCIEKVTRVHNHSSSLIDHILTNNLEAEVTSGVVMSDISDHFPVFLELPVQKTKNKTKFETSRKFSRHCLENFHENLSLFEWNDVQASNDVDVAYGNFWNSFKTLYDLIFPPIKKKFNKNFHKINAYMTQGLLILEDLKLAYSRNQLMNPLSQIFKTTKISVIYTQKF